MRPATALRRRLGWLRRVRRDGRQLLAQRQLLRRGFYVNDGPTLWRHSAASVPTFLAATKAGRKPRVRRPRPLPIFVAGTGSATLAVKTFEGGGVYLDLENQTVTRTYPATSPVTEQHIRLRQRFERHTDAPPGRFADDGLSHTEPYVEGRHLEQLPASLQEEAVRRLFRDYARLVAAEGAGDATGSMQASIRECLQLELPAALANRARGAVQWLEQVEIPLIPSAREANLKNLIVASDHRVSPIDLGDLAVLPSIWYPIGIVCEAPHAISQLLLAGGLDSEISSLLAPNGLGTSFERPQWRKELLTARMLHVAVCDARASSGDGGQNALATEVLRRWKATAPLLS